MNTHIPHSQNTNTTHITQTLDVYITYTEQNGFFFLSKLSISPGGLRAERVVNGARNKAFAPGSCVQRARERER